MVNRVSRRVIGVLVALSFVFSSCAVRDGSDARWGPTPVGAQRASQTHATSTKTTPQATGEEPTQVSVCQLKSDPAAYNHKLVQVTGFVSHGFEDFTLSDPSCSSWPSIWLEYGGVAASGTMYCCGVTAARNRPEPLVVENISIPLLDDAVFRKFDKLLQRRPDAKVHATIVGRFFSGKQDQDTGVSSWGGYGHMGCCGLLAIQQVISVDPSARSMKGFR